MRILFLGYKDSPLIDFLRNDGHMVTVTEEAVNANSVEELKTDFIISYGYRHIIREDVLNRFNKKAINLHISFLPWNRGADANLWSWIDDTPKGATIHFIDKGIDTGDIIVQTQVAFTGEETLKTSYEKLQREIQRLFCQHWKEIAAGRCKSSKQKTGGSFHKSADKDAIFARFKNGWDTRVSELLTMKSKVEDHDAKEQFIK